MAKYLALSKGEKEKIGVCFYNELESFFEFSLIPLSQIKDKVDIYQPNYLLCSRSWISLVNKIDEIKSNFPNLEFILVSDISILEKEIIDGVASIPGLERKPSGSGTSRFLSYPKYYFAGKKINNTKKKALLVMYLHKPWQVVNKVELIFGQSEETDQNDFSEKFSDKFDNSELLKNINMTDLSSQVQELNWKLTQMSKLSYLGTLKSQEILFLVEKTRKFAKILDNFYTLKKDEEASEEKENTKINNNESNE
ncbi:MAG: hypothetical protein I3273_04175 [Candidatus Moeniiplasma glomeromycotorum]|nr:hypothetical protein [Candidatus Moeniiplasma glomeromycotorum]